MIATMLFASDTFQFTPLREGRRQRGHPQWATETISIHAPPRGATSPQTNGKTRLRFQFTPLREGRRCAGAGKRSGIYFNSRPSAKGRRFIRLDSVASTDISIHAPPRGATCFFCTGKNRHEFQFTPLREGRRSFARLIQHPERHFNSRPSARGDLGVPLLCMTQFISIHAPPRGATQGVSSCIVMC